MAENIIGLKRTAYCGDITEEYIGKEITLMGWVQKRRVLGGLLFVDLRDREGICQVVFDEADNKELFDKAYTLRSEYVIAIKGTVRERESKNDKIKTGSIEVLVKELRILSKAQTPPFEIVPNSDVNEELRLKYRYLDLRRSDLKDNIIMRHKITKAVRDYYSDNGFIEIETPMLIKSTPEGARDFLVPSRIHNGNFYALPQSPQLYKQLLMVGGFDRYFQIARCFRDEDLRADRQPEFTQIDLEMSFVDMEDVLEINEGFIKYLFKTVLNIDIPTPIKRLTYKEAMEKYGSDKPDIRFGLEITDISDIVKDCGFSVFSGACEKGSVRGICVPKGASFFSRKDLDKLTEYVKGIGGKGLAWAKLTKDGINSSFAKFMTEEEINNIIERMGACEDDLMLFAADSKNKMVLSVLGALRLEIGNRMNLIPKDNFEFLWVTQFPFFEWDEDSQTFLAMHHPFTSPMEEDIPLLDTDKGNVRAKAYDLVLNGIELSSGSIRITDPDLQSKMFASLGLSDEEAYEKFGFLLDAFKYGAPPHGGMGIGLDRLVMLMLKKDNLRDVLAFPKVQNASELMTMCPSSVDKLQLDDLGIAVTNKEEM